MKNMVDERFELAAVICRLAGNPEYSSPDFGVFNTDYHREVAETFAPFATHEAVEYAKNLSNIICYDKVLKFAVHITKTDGRFIFIDDINSLFGAWNEENSKEFLKLYNKFYVDTNYAEFYNSKISYFEEFTQKFIDGFYGSVDFEWFEKYMDPSDLRCIYSPSGGNYGATVNDKIVYCLVMGNGGAIVHEYCHHLACKFADIWYNENDEFKKWCNDSVNAEKMPYYNSGWVMANEYITRAYDILYQVQHGAELEECISRERDFQFKDSFKYIGQVYNMILESE